MKIVFPTDDGETISALLGMARDYTLVDLEAAHVPRREQRPKLDHENGRHEHGGHRHASIMLEAVMDCQVLISRGMGQPAYDHAVAGGLQVILTGERSIGAALAAYRAGRLLSNPRRVHPHYEGRGRQ
ncbi:MAG: NifB/NifX family molybdenum-iron cluster-binding protein [Chloroflexota bacterium]